MSKDNVTSRTRNRMALLLNWRDKGFTRPHYGLIDDDELLRTGSASFLSSDGSVLVVVRSDLLLLGDTSISPVSVPASQESWTIQGAV